MPPIPYECCEECPTEMLLLSVEVISVENYY